jgi:hypothetical protein
MHKEFYNFIKQFNIKFYNNLYLFSFWIVLEH